MIEQASAEPRGREDHDRSYDEDAKPAGASDVERVLNQRPYQRCGFASSPPAICAAGSMLGEPSFVLQPARNRVAGPMSSSPREP